MKNNELEKMSKLLNSKKSNADIIEAISNRIDEVNSQAIEQENRLKSDIENVNNEINEIRNMINEAMSEQNSEEYLSLRKQFDEANSRLIALNEYNNHIQVGDKPLVTDAECELIKKIISERAEKLASSTNEKVKSMVKEIRELIAPSKEEYRKLNNIMNKWLSEVERKKLDPYTMHFGYSFEPFLVADDRLSSIEEL